MSRWAKVKQVVRRPEVLPNGDYTQFAWRALRKFHNVPSCTSIIIERRSVPKKHERNVRKQMEQLRFSLIQAQEYFDAAETASAATKPLQLYISEARRVGKECVSTCRFLCAQHP